MSSRATDPHEVTDVPGAGSLEQCVESDLGWALGVVFRRYAKESEAVLCDVPGGTRGYQVLTTAGSGRPDRQQALAKRLGIDRTVMTYLLDDLEAGGLVERRADPTDRRARLVVLTAQGLAVIGKVRDGLQAAETEVLSGLPDRERSAFRELLQRVAMQADAISPDGAACDGAAEMLDVAAKA